MESRKKIRRRIMRKINNRYKRMDESREELMAKIAVATHPEYDGSSLDSKPKRKKKKSMMQKKTEKKRPTYTRQGVEYEEYYKKK